MDNRKKIIIGLIAGIIFIISFILNLLFPPKPFIKSAHANGYTGSFVITSGSLNQTVAEHDSALYDWLEGQGAVDENYTYNDFLLDLSSAYIGSKTGINDNLVDAAIDGLYDVLLDVAFGYDTTSGFIVYPHEADSFLSDFQHIHGYDYSSDGAVVGYWYPMGVESDIKVQDNGSKLQNKFLSNYGDVYVCAYASGNYTCFCFASKSLESRSGYIERYYDPTGSSGFSLSATYNFNLSNSYAYSGRIVGYYRNSSQNYTDGSFYGNVGIASSRYSNLNSALADFFEQDWIPPSPEPVFNGNVYIDDSLNPINLLNVPGNNGRARSVQRNTDINNNITNNYGGYNDIVLSPKLEDIPNNYEYELPVYPEIPHDLPTVTFEYPEIVGNEEISSGLDGLSPLWVTLLTMGGSFIVLKVIL